MLALIASTLVLALAPQQSAPPTPTDLTPTEKMYGLSLFWKEASDHFAFFKKVPDVDWDKCYQEYIPKVLATKNVDEYYDVMQEFARLLRDSHTDINPPPRQTPRPQLFSPGISLGWNTGESRLYAFNVYKEYEKEIPPGSEIVAVEGKPLLEYVTEKWGADAGKVSEKNRIPFLISRALSGPEEGSVVKFTIVTPSGQRQEVSAVRKRTPNPQWAWDAWPKRDPYLEYRDLGNGIAYVALYTFASPKTGEEFDKLVPTLQKAKGLIIDLRYNGGGNDLVGVRVCQNFTTGSFKSFASKTREVKSAYKAWGAFVDEKAPNLSDWDKKVLKNFKGDSWFDMKPEVFQGHKDAKLLMPKVVLIGGGTASAAEDTVIYLNDIPNVTTVGQRTYGGTGQPLIFDLPGGGVARVCTQYCTLPDGGEFMGIGLTPQVPAPEPTIQDRLHKRDPTLDKGLEVLNAKLHANR